MEKSGKMTYSKFLKTSVQTSIGVIALMATCTTFAMIGILGLQLHGVLSVIEAEEEVNKLLGRALVIASFFGIVGSICWVLFVLNKLQSKLLLP